MSLQEIYTSGKIPWQRKKTNLSGWLEKAEVFSGDVLDLGCGTGEIAIWLAKNNFFVEAIDLSREAIKIANNYDAPNVSFSVWNLEELSKYPFKKKKYDLVVDSKTLRFIQDKEAYFSIIAPKLKGVFIVQTFLKHKEKPFLVIEKDYLEGLILNYFKIKEKSFYPFPTKQNPDIVMAEYFLVPKK